MQKKIFFLITALFLSLIFPLKIKAYNPSTELCCPEGYSDSFWSCPITANRNTQCCKRHGLFNYEVVEKKLCSEVYPDDSDKTIRPKPYDLTQDRLAALNPLNLFSKESDFHEEGRLSLSGLISRALSFIFPLAGLALFVMLIWGGFEILTGAADKQNLDAGRQRITAAITGFILLLAAYAIIQFISYATGVVIFS